MANLDLQQNPLADAQPQSIIDRYNAQAVELLSAAELSPENEPPELVPLLFYIDGQCERETPLLNRGTLSMITGQKGCRKSTFVYALCNVLLNGKMQSECAHTFTTNKYKLRIAVIDTEQTPARLHSRLKWLQTTYTHGSEFVRNFTMLSAYGKSSYELRNMLVTLCSVKAPDIIFIDVISSLVDEINDQTEAKETIDLLNQICNKYGTAIVGTIHQNPSTKADAADKMQGAIGTKLWQAAECVLNVARAKEEDTLADGTKLFANSSVISFVEYRDRLPDVRQILLQNMKDGGLNLQPVSKAKAPAGKMMYEPIKAGAVDFVYNKLHKAAAEQAQQIISESEIDVY